MAPSAQHPSLVLTGFSPHTRPLHDLVAAPGVITSEDEHIADIEVHDFPHPTWPQREARASHDIKQDTEGGVGRRAVPHVHLEGARVVIGAVWILCADSDTPH